MHDEYFYWRGMRIHVQNDGEGEPLLLINGLGSSTDMWEPLVRHLKGRQILRFDAPGAGRSSTPPFPITIDALADLAAGVLDDHEIESADVLGYSYGGAVAQQLAFDHPDRVRLLVLAATNCGIGALPGSLRAMNVLATPFRYYSPTYFERIAPHAYGGRTGRSPDVRRRMMRTRQKFPPSSRGYTMQLLGGMCWSSSHYLDAIRHQTLVICGDDDPLIPIFNAHLLAARIPNSMLEIVEGAGHLFLCDDAKNVGRRVLEFIGA